MTDHDVRLSKRMSYVLRHDPASIGARLDEYGWINIDALAHALTANGYDTTNAAIRAVATTSPKQRFQIVGDRVRAAQGHSIDIDLDLSAIAPPALLYHGTTSRFAESIQREGLRPMSRTHVHLSADPTTAVTVGRRHGTPIVLTIDAYAMHEAGHEFLQAANGVWLTDHVPPDYLAWPSEASE